MVVPLLFKFKKNYFIHVLGSLLFLMLSSSVFAAKDPIVFELLGFDPRNGIVYLTRTDWGKCNCETELYKFYIKNDSMEIISGWCNREEYAKEKASVLKKRGLHQLSKLYPLPNTGLSICKFSWLPRENEFGLIPPEMKDKYPFQLDILKNKYTYIQCYSNAVNPRIKQFRISNNSNFIFMTFKEDCELGTTTDVLIICTKQMDNLIVKEVR